MDVHDEEREGRTLRGHFCRLVFCFVDCFPCDVPESQSEPAEIVETYQSDRNVITEMVVDGSREGVGLLYAKDAQAHPETELDNPEETRCRSSVSKQPGYPSPLHLGWAISVQKLPPLFRSEVLGRLQPEDLTSLSVSFSPKILLRAQPALSCSRLDAVGAELGRLLGRAASRSQRKRAELIKTILKAIGPSGLRQGGFSRSVLLLAYWHKGCDQKPPIDNLS